MSTGTLPDEAIAQALEPDTVELHVRNVPRAVWLKARQAALASRLRFGQYIIRLLENADPVTVTPPAGTGGALTSPPISQSASLP